MGALRRLGWWTEAALIPAALAGVLLVQRGLPLVVGQQFVPAVGALVPILVLLPLLPLPLLGWQGAALELRPGIALAIQVVGLLAFTVTAVLLVPKWGAQGGSAGLLSGVAASSLLAAWKLPAAVSPRLLLLGALGAVSVLALAARLDLTG